MARKSKIDNPADNLLGWARCAEKWLGKRLGFEALVLGDVIYDQYMIGSPRDERGRFGVLEPLQCSTDTIMLGGAAKGFEFVKGFVKTSMLGSIGDDYQGRWIEGHVVKMKPAAQYFKSGRQTLTPAILRILRDDPVEQKRSRFLRVDRYDPNQRSLLGLSASSLRKVSRCFGLVLIYDHGLGTVTEELLRSIDKLPDDCCVVARLKHSDLSLYHHSRLDALIINWTHVAPTQPFPRTDIEAKNNQILLDLLSAFTRTKNLVLLGNGGEVLVLTRHQGTTAAATLYHLARVSPEERGVYFTGAGHIFAGIVGLVLASRAGCTPVGAVCLGLLAAIDQRNQNNPQEFVNKNGLKHFLNTKTLSDVVVCSRLCNLADEKTKHVEAIIREFRTDPKIDLTTNRSPLGVPAISPISQQFLGSLVSAAGNRDRSAIVWIYGGSGTGKTRYAESLHRSFARSGKVSSKNCTNTTFPEIEKALRAVEGGGTLFLDEIGWNSDAVQEIRSRLISLLDEITRKTVDNVLLVLASSQNPEEVSPPDFVGRVKEHGRILRIPNLDEIYPDIPYLVCEAIEEAAKARKAKQIKRIKATTLARLMLFDYGDQNLRSLRSVVTEIIKQTRGRCIGTRSLPPNVTAISVDHILETDFQIDFIW